jgi:polyisoprenoid-binding protein YceI
MRFTQLPLLILTAAAVALLATRGDAVPASPAATVTPLGAEARTYTIDAVHSAVLFRTTHLGLSAAWGRFNAFEGELTFSEDASACAVRVSIDPASVDSASTGRDDHLKGQDFLNVAQFPKATFVSSKVALEEGGALSVSGTLSLHGVEKEVTFEARLLGEGDRGERFGKRIGFEGELVINRRDFGMTTYPNEAIGDEIRLILAFEGAGK